VLEVRRDFKDVMSGINTSDHFDELDRVLSQRYESVHEENIFRLVETETSRCNIRARHWPV